MIKMGKMADVDYAAQHIIGRDKWMTHDACDWLSDNRLERISGERVWDMPGDRVAELIAQHYPDGATGWIIDLVHGTLKSTPAVEQQRRKDRALDVIFSEDFYRWSASGNAVQQGIEDIVDGYLGAQLWTATDTRYDDDGEEIETIELDSMFSVEDFPDDYRQRVTDELTDWVSSLPLAIRLYAARRRHNAGEGSVWEHLGHDILLTRDRSGAGFCDRGLGELGDYLTKMCQPMGESSHLFIHEDNGSLRADNN